MPLKKLSSRTSVGRKVATSTTNTAVNLNAPVGGLNFIVPITQQKPEDAVQLVNMICRPYGVELREGYQQWVTANGQGIAYTLMAYLGADQTTNKLFAAYGDNSVYDVTERDNEGLEITITGQTVPGECSHVNFVTDGGTYLLAVFQGAGYYVYNGTTWAAVEVGPEAGKISFPAGDTTTIDELAFVTLWKNRVWFIKHNSSKAFYLPVGQYTGVLEVFDFGALFMHGGRLEMLASWTMDGGAGIDDKLIVISQTGDLLIYEGTDPSEANAFNMVGRWFVGRAPAGRRFVSEYGGDIIIVSHNGIVFLSNLLQLGGKFHNHVLASGKVSSMIANEVSKLEGKKYWEIVYLPKKQIALINSPNLSETSYTQYIYEVNTHGWSTFQSIPMVSAVNFMGELYFSHSNGTICKGLIGDSDNADLDDNAGAEIVGTVQTSWNSFNSPQTIKKFMLVQPYFIAEAPPSIKVQLNVDWSTQRVAGAPGFQPPIAARWDQAIWDQAKWAGGKKSFNTWSGVDGIGRFASLQMSIVGIPGTLFTNFVMVCESGGIL